MRQWILLAVILSAGIAAAHTVTMNYAVRVGDNVTNNTVRVNDTDYFYNSLQAILPTNDIVLLMYMDNSTNDSSFYGNNGTAINGVNCSSGVSGKIGSACSFDGINDYIEINRSTSIEPQNFTLAAWVYLRDKLAYQVIFDKPFTSHIAPFYTYNFRFRNLSNTVKMEIYVVNDTFDGNDTVIVTLAESAVYNRWMHVAATYDQTYISMYLDGNLVARQYNKGAIIYHDTNLSIGRFRNLGSGYVNGSIDEVVVWNRSLSESEIYSLFAASKYFNTLNKKYISINKTNTLAGIVSASDFSSAYIDTSYTRSIINSSNLIALHLDKNVLDSSFWGNNGTINGNVDCAFNVTGKINGACIFGGGYVNFSALNIETTKNYTITVWIRTTVADGGIFSQSDGTSSHLIALLLSGGSAAFNTFEGGAGNIADNIVINDNNWHHVTVTKRGTTGNLYVDGVLRTTGVVATPSGTNESRIGTAHGGSNLFLGNIDEFLVYDYPLSDGEIFKLYEHNPRFLLAQMTQNTGRFMLTVTNGTYTDVENRLPSINLTQIVSTTFGGFARYTPSSFPFFIRLEYSDIDIDNRLEWSSIGRLLIKNIGLNARGIPIVRLELII